MEDQDWYKIEDAETVITPSLVVYPDRIEANIKTMIALAGGTQFLRPHVKTYKMAEVITLQMDYGIFKFKCATIAEAELLASCGAKDILLAMQPVGVNIDRYFNLMDQYPQSEFSTIVDNHNSIRKIANSASVKSIKVSLWLDINNGMNRTGVSPGVEALELYQTIASNPHLNARGLHVYDGHIHDSEISMRKKVCDDAFNPVLQLKKDIENSGIKLDTIVAGGSPTFSIHAMRENVEVSPGTTLLWDQGYSNAYKDLKFIPAAVLITRVISKPKSNFICFDLGHKSVAPEMKLPRVHFLNCKTIKHVSHSEEHLVIESETSESKQVGDMCYAVPIHICPTVAKYKQVLTIENRKITGSWEVAARDSRIHI